MLASRAALGITSTTRPCSMTQCRSATVAAKRKFCSTRRKVKPRRAMRFEGRATSSCPSKRIEPSRRGTMPMMDLSVVVLPAPLRPSSVTTSPARTSKPTPCRMCDSPYQAWRSRISSRELSGMAGAHVRLDDVRVLRDGGVVALGQDLAAGEHGDAVGEIGYHAEVVLDHEHGAVRGDLPDEGGDALDVLVGHARRRLVEQHHLGIEGEGGSDLERPLAPVGQLHGGGGREGGEAHRLHQPQGPAVEPPQPPLRSPEVEGAPPPPLEGDPDIL